MSLRYIFFVTVLCAGLLVSYGTFNGVWAEESVPSTEDLGPSKKLFTIDEVRLSGLKKVEKEAVFEKIKAKKGVTADNYLIRDDIRTIYKLNYFEHVKATKLVEGGKNILSYDIIEKPIIAEIKLSGNSAIDQDKLLEVIKSKQYTIIDINKINADVKALQKHYEEKGFYLASVSYKTEEVSKESVKVIFQIQEYDQVRVKQIAFLGNKAFSDKELKSIIETREETLFSFMSGGGSFKEDAFQVDIERLKYFYATKGYIQANIASPEITISDDKRWVFITMKVNEGPQFSVNNITFQGEMLFTEAELFEKIKLQKEQIYSEALLREDIQTLTELYQDQGYAFANVIRNLVPIPGENKVNIDYSFEKGKLTYFGNITVKGNNQTRDKVVRRELKIFEGKKYSGSGMRLSKEAVDRLGYFENNSVVFNTISRTDRDDLLDVEITVKERSTGQISLGAGYSTASKGFIQASISKQNFLGLGQELKFSTMLAKNRQDFTLGFTEPYLMDTEWTAGADLFLTNDQYSAAYDLRKKGFDLRVGHPIFEFTRLYLTYKLEDTQLSNPRDKTLNLDVENGIASSVSALVVNDTRNNRMEPSGGYYLASEYEFAGVGGDKDWLKLSLDGRYYKRVWGDLVLRSRARFDKLDKVNGKPIPRSEMFELGGARDMRGYDYEAIGPKHSEYDDNGILRTYNDRGLCSFLSTVEFEHPLAREAGLKWALFMDAGNIWSTYMGDRGDFALKYDYGFGFRWFSPIGVLRFEFAWPLGGDSGSQFHFDIGQVF